MQTTFPKIAEERLANGLQPIRQFVLAQALFNFMNLGIAEAIGDSIDKTVSSLAEKLGLHEHRLSGFLRYLANEGYVLLSSSGVVSLTATGHDILDFRPWYTLLIGGYAQTFLQLPTVMRIGGPYAARDSSAVGVGSCGISQYDALPMTRQLLGKIAGGWRTIVDLGCGDGSYLVDLCRSIPTAHGLGLDPDPTSVKSAQASARGHGLADRVEIRVGSATDIPDLSQEPGPLCFITAFVLQELLEQSGRAAVVGLLRSTFARYPNAHWIVVEVDHRPEDPSVMQTALGLAYYNPYYLIHELTEQKLETVAFWEKLYAEAGLRVLAVEHPESTYDSLRLKIGFLLGPN